MKVLLLHLVSLMRMSVMLLVHARMTVASRIARVSSPACAHRIDQIVKARVAD